MRPLVLPLLLSSTLVTGCGGADRGSGGGDSHGCTPGATQECVCSGDKHGGQVCEGDGARWGPCDCDPGEGEGEGPACTDDCTAGRSECVDAGWMHTCADHDGDGCAEWSAPRQCNTTEVCRAGRCEARSTGDACTGHEDCPGEQVCHPGTCAPMYGRSYLFSVTYVRLRRAAEDVGSAPDPYVKAYVGDEEADEWSQFGATWSASDRYEAEWDEQSWEVRLEEGTAIRLSLWDSDPFSNDWLDAAIISAPFNPEFIKAEAWSLEWVDPDRPLQEIRGTVCPGGE